MKFIICLLTLVGSSLYAASPHSVLGVGSSATKQEIKSAYRKLAKQYHPDTPETGNVVKFREVQQAYEDFEKNNFDIKIQSQSQRESSYSWPRSARSDYDNLDAMFAADMNAYAHRADVLSGAEPVQSFFRTFFSDSGKLITVDTFVLAFTGQWTVTKEMNEVYQSILERKSRAIWYAVGRFGIGTGAFIRQSLSPTISSAIVQNLMSIAEQIEYLEREGKRVNQDVTIAIGLWRTAAIDLMGLLTKVCGIDAYRDCIAEFVELMAQRSPRILPVFSKGSANVAILFIDQIISNRDREWLMGAEYRKLMKFRNQLKGLHHGFRDRAVECASLLMGHAKRKYLEK